jgi:uncharacterized protein (TIGR03435 family)
MHVKAYNAGFYRSILFRLTIDNCSVPAALRSPIILALAAVTSYGQQSTEPPKYEVASIKPNSDDASDYSFHIGSDGSIAAAGITLKRLMMTAFNVQGFRILGGPAWVSSRRWELQARPDRPASPGQIRGMLRALLEERFLLHTHAEVRQLPVYELIADRKGSKVPVARESKEEVRVGPGSIRLTDAKSATFASQLSYALGQPVIDKTGLSGNFDFALQWTPEPGENGGPTTEGLPTGTQQQPPSNSDGPSIFTAIREQLGLVLKATHGPVEVIAIDAAQIPAGN